MIYLKYKTRGNSTPQGKQKIYFSAEPKDFDTYFEELSEEILEVINCAIWYRVDADEPGAVALDENEYISEFRLLVVPVTSRLLSNESIALNYEIPFARDKHIPLLPIVLEDNLIDRFTEAFGKIEYLDKAKFDPTKISYEDKLAGMLKSILVADELLQKIKDSFDAYIFLSYRKKDRDYANKLMRLIHKSPACRNFAIWYDEYLVPGEKYNDAIQEALEKSDFFSLLVTPNLINEENYVQTTEYPMARSRRKYIFPVEMVTTDRKLLAEQYEGIPEVIKPDSEDALEASILRGAADLAIQPRESSPEHIFFIGLAYLGGIDVERNETYAFELISSAAEDGLAEAMDKLSSMYRNGDGVDKNYAQALAWQEKLFKKRKAEFEKSPSLEGLVCLYEVTNSLSDYYFESRSFEEHSNLLVYFSEAAESYEPAAESEKIFLALLQARAFLARSVVAVNDKGDIKEEQRYLEHGIEKLREDVSEHTELLAYMCYFLSESYIEHMGDLECGTKWLSKAMNLYKALYSRTGESKFLFYQARIYALIGKAHMRLNHNRRALSFYTKAVEIDRQAVAENKKLTNLKSYLAEDCLQLGNLYFLRFKFKSAEQYLSEAVDITESMADTDNISSMLNLCAAYSACADREKLVKVYEILSDLLTRTNSTDVLGNYISACNNLGDYTSDFSEAGKYYWEMLEKSEELVKRQNNFATKDTLARSYAKVVDVGIYIKDYEEAFTYADKLFDIREEICRGNSTDYNKRELLNAVKKVRKVLRKAHPFTSISKRYQYVKRAALAINNK